MCAAQQILLVVCLVFGNCKVCSQDYPFIKYTPKDGLINSRVQNFYQDQKGRIFFMTANGLSVYDGARFLNYGIEDGLASPIVNDILELSTDSLLIATNTGTLNTWVRGTIKTFPTKNGFCPVINKFYRGKDNIIYVASDQGLYRFEKNVFTPLGFDDKTGNPVKGFDEIMEIGNFFLFRRVTPSPGFSNLVLVHKQTLQSAPFPVKGYVSCVLAFKEEQLLLVIADQKILSLDLNAAELGILKYKKLPPRFQSLVGLMLFKIVIDRFYNIWGFTNNTVVRLKQDGSLQSYDKTNGLDVNNIRSVAVDKENVLWIITDGSGVLKLVNRNVELLSTDISAIYEDSSGKTWTLSSSGRILYCADENGIQSWRLNSTVKNGSLGMRKKSLILFDELSIYETEAARESGHLSLKKIYSGIDPLNHSRYEIGYNDNIYIPGNILTVIQSSNNVTKMKMPNYVDQVSLDDHQQLWAVSRFGDLLCYKINQQNSLQPLDLIYTDKLTIREPRSIVMDKTGQLWIGTRYSGLYCLQYKDKKMVSKRHWTTAQGLTDNFIYYLSCDNNNVIWAGTQGGLDKISCSGNVVESITRNNNIYQVIHKIVLGKDNNVWAMGAGGIIRVTNDGILAGNYQPQLQIIRMRSGDKNLGLLPDRTLLPPATRELTIDVAAPSFIDEKRVRYSYLLDGNDKDQWSSPTHEASFRFINLQPAKYTLRIRAFFPVGHYATQDLVYHFTILPPWWQTWWFRTSLVIISLMVVRFMIKAYYQKKLQKQQIIFEREQAIQQERTRIAMEMHDDLGSGLTAIRYLAGGLIANSIPSIKERAVKIESSAKQLVDNMNDIIWTIKSDNNGLADILGYIRKQAADMLENVGIDYRFDFPKDPGDFILTNEQKRNLLLISKEAVHNIIKHSQATMVMISARQNEKYLHLSFSDNGKGLDHAGISHSGNGLKNMHQRTEQIRGNIEIINAHGTTVIVTIRMA